MDDVKRARISDGCNGNCCQGRSCTCRPAKRSQPLTDAGVFWVLYLVGVLLFVALLWAVWHRVFP